MCVGEEEAAHVVLQGGLRAILVAMDVNPGVKMVRWYVCVCGGGGGAEEVKGE